MVLASLLLLRGGRCAMKMGSGRFLLRPCGIPPWPRWSRSTRGGTGVRDAAAGWEARQRANAAASLSHVACGRWAGAIIRWMHAVAASGSLADASVMGGSSAPGAAT